jgi:hypothetical protein
VTGDSRKVRQEELRDLHCSPSVVRDDNRAGRVARIGSTCRVLWGDVKERDHWEDQAVDGWIILKCPTETGWEGMDWIRLAKWRADVNTVMNLRVP